MNNIEIYKNLKKDSFANSTFRAVLPRDKLPKTILYPSSFVINTHTSKQVGEHWLALYYDKNGKCTFFDSYGLDPSYYKLDSYLKSTSICYVYNKQRLQALNSKYCGQYCIYFIL